MAKEENKTGMDLGIDFDALLEEGQQDDGPKVTFEEKEDKDKSKEEEDDFTNYDVTKEFATDSKEEEEKETKKEETSESSPSTVDEEKDTDDSSVSYPLAFARYQLERGNLTDLNEEELQKVVDEEGEDAAFAYIFETEVKKNNESIRNELLEQYEDDVKDYLSLRESGVDVPDARNIAQSKKFYDTLKEEDIESDDKEKLRADVLTDWYKQKTQFKPEKIRKLVDNHISLGEDVEMAKEAVTEMKEHFSTKTKEYQEMAEKQQEEFKRQNEKQLEELKNKIDGLDEVIPGQKVNKQTKDKIHDLITKPVAQDDRGNVLNHIWNKRAQDPFKFDTMLAYLDILGVLDGKTDKLLKPAKTQATSELADSIKSDKRFGSKAAKGMKKGDSDVGQALAGLWEK